MSAPTAKEIDEMVRSSLEQMRNQTPEQRAEAYLAQLHRTARLIPDVTVEHARLEGDILHIDFTMPRGLAIEMGLIEPEPIEVTVVLTKPEAP